MAVIGNNGGNYDFSAIHAEISRLASQLQARDRQAPEDSAKLDSKSQSQNNEVRGYTVNNRELSYLHTNVSFHLQDMSSQQQTFSTAGFAAAAYDYVSGVANPPQMQFELLHPFNRRFDFKV